MDNRDDEIKTACMEVVREFGLPEDMDRLSRAIRNLSHRKRLTYIKKIEEVAISILLRQLSDLEESAEHDA